MPMDSIKYCYHGYGSPGKVGLIRNDGAYRECDLPEEASILVFNKLRTYIKGFESVKPYDCKAPIAEVKVPAGIYLNACYILKNNAIHLVRSRLLRGPKDNIEVQNIGDIIWCQQLFDSDEGCESHIIELYCLRQKNPCRLYFKSGYDAFQFVLELKRRIPHLLYGYNEKYTEIFKRNPAELLAIGKRQMNQ